MNRSPNRPLVRLLTAITGALALVGTVGSTAAADDPGTADATGAPVVLVPPSPRQGPLVSLEILGGGLTLQDEAGGWRRPLAGPGGELRWGEAIFGWLDLGIAGGGVVGFDEELQVFAGHLLIEGAVRPSERLSLRLGLGVGFASVTRRSESAPRLPGRFGDAYRVAAGYDFFVTDERRSGGLALTPTLFFEAGPQGDMPTLVAGLGLAVTWWTGLPRAELELPDDEAYAR